MKAEKGTCPICLRSISLNDDRSLRRHNQRAKTKRWQEPKRCPGSGQQPIDQVRIPIQL